jgi:hypothetical protein
MSGSELQFLYLVIGAMTLFGVVLAWTAWYSNRS